MNEIKLFILRFTKERNLTVIALAEKLGYKSKTSLDRLMNANSRESSIQKFEELMLTAFDLNETERAALHRAVRIACEGEEQYRISEKMHALLFTHNIPPDAPKPVLRDAETNAAVNWKNRYQHAKNMRVIVWDCRGIPALFSLLARLMRERPLSVTHYLTESRDRLATMAALEAIFPVLYRPEYEGFIIPRQGRNDELHQSDLLFIDWTDEQGARHGDIISFHSPHAGRLVEVDQTTFERLLHLFKEPQPCTPLKMTYPEYTSFEDYIRYSADIAALEHDHSVWKVKPDLCVDLIPPYILEAALMRGPVTPKDETYCTVIHALRRVYDKRYQNTFGKKKHCFTLLKQKAMQNFVETGRTTDHFWAMDTFTKRERVEIIFSLLEQQLHNPYVHLLFLKDDDAIRDMEVICYGNEGVMLLETDIDYRFDRQTDVMITHPDIVKLYQDFFMKSLVKEYALPESKTVAIFKGWLANELG